MKHKVLKFAFIVSILYVFMFFSVIVELIDLLKLSPLSKVNLSIKDFFISNIELSVVALFICLIFILYSTKPKFMCAIWNIPNNLDDCKNRVQHIEECLNKAEKERLESTTVLMLNLSNQNKSFNKDKQLLEQTLAHFKKEIQLNYKTVFVHKTNFQYQLIKICNQTPLKEYSSMQKCYRDYLESIEVLKRIP